jgi:3-methylcrotonyl-CoA carboxylase alpha subunit
VLALTEPAGLPNVRVDSGLQPGMRIGSDYDPMLSKVIAWGPDRDHARRALSAALASTTVLGVTTNIAFLRSVLHDPDVVSGAMDTGLLQRITERLPVRTIPESVRVAAAVTSIGGRTPPDDPWDDRRGWRLGQGAATRWQGSIDDQEIDIELSAEPDSHAYNVTSGDRVRLATAEEVDGRLSVTLDGETTAFRVVRDGHTTWLGAEGVTWRVTERPLRAPGNARHPGGTSTLNSPMPGTVVALLAQAGDIVVVDQPIVVVEAMKMEHTIRSPVDGTVSDVAVAVGQSVGLHQLLAMITPA